MARTNTTYSYDGSTMVTEYVYDDNDRIIAELENKGMSDEHAITYTYDAKGNIATQKFPLHGKIRTEYTYDDKNRMISWQNYGDTEDKEERSSFIYYGDRIDPANAKESDLSTSYDEIERFKDNEGAMGSWEQENVNSGELYKRSMTNETFLDKQLEIFQCCIH